MTELKQRLHDAEFPTRGLILEGVHTRHHSWDSLGVIPHRLPYTECRPTGVSLVGMEPAGRLDVRSGGDRAIQGGWTGDTPPVPTAGEWLSRGVQLTIDLQSPVEDTPFCNAVGIVLLLDLLRFQPFRLDGAVV